MKKIPETQTTTEISWQKRAEKAEAQVEILLQEMEYMKAQMRLMNAKRYGSSSEKANENQLKLFDGFNEAEATAEPFAPEPEVDLITVPEHKRAKKKVRETPVLTDCRKTLLRILSCGHDRYVINQEITREFTVNTP